MELCKVNKEEYLNVVKNSKYSYNEPWFHDINKEKVEKQEYFLFRTKKYKMGIIAGISDGVMKFPYSAPFSMFEKLNSDISIEDIENVLNLLEEYALEINLNRIYFRLPPAFYDEGFITKIINCLIRKKYDLEYFDLNYQYNLISEEYLHNCMKRNAKKNLRIAEQQNYNLILCKNYEMKKKAYDIIAANRKRKGYPLRMSWEQVSKTIKKMVHDIFVLELDGMCIAAAIIFKVTEDIYQVVYWGDIEGYAGQKPINYLSYHLYLYYLKQGKRILDIGPSTEEGIPNYGLCDFKESIGCDISGKATYSKLLL